MKRQFLITLITTCLLTGVGWFYHTYVNPMLVPPVLSLPQAIPVTPPEHQLGPIENRELALKHLKHVEWVVNQNPGYQVKFGDKAYIFARADQ
ncbi:MAG: hypothetical protein R3C11_02275 [Planctomycetaceae bacterium]